MPKACDPPLIAGALGPLDRVDKAIRLAQQRLAAAMDATSHHTNQDLANEVVKATCEALRKTEKLRVLKTNELETSGK